MIREYPDSISEELIYFLPLLRGKIPNDVPFAVRCAYNLEGYALKHLVGDGSALTAAAKMDGRSVDREALATMLEAHFGISEGTSPVRSLQIPWGTLWVIAREMIDAWLVSR